VTKQQEIIARMGRDRSGEEVVNEAAASSEILESYAARGKIKRFIKQTSIPYYPPPGRR
jgi:hypothetical protein